MPSIGGLENTRNKDSDFGQVSSVISEELSGQNSSPKIKSAGVIIATQKESPNRTETTMAPNKNGETDTDCKTHTEQKELSTDVPSSKDLQEDHQVSGEKDLDSVAEQEQKDQDAGEDDSNRTAEEKRIEFKNNRRASSLEILGLKKQLGKIENQGILDPSIESQFEMMKRRVSAPAKFHYATRKTKTIQEGEEGERSVERLTEEMEKVQVDEKKGPGFSQRLETEEKESNGLTSKGPIRGAPNQQRVAPYHQGQQVLDYPINQVSMMYSSGPVMHQYVPSQVPMGIYQTPSAQPMPTHPVKMVCPSGKRVVVPGQQRSHMAYTQLPDNANTGRSQMYNIIQQHPNTQRNQTLPALRRQPEEAEWPPSPTGIYPCDLNSPGSIGAASPEQPMQTAPSPAYSTGYAQHSPMMHSPQSVSSADTAGMSTSPGSPYSPDFTSLQSPASVRSDDSGIASPPHQPAVQQYRSSSGTNSGTVTYHPVPSNVIPTAYKSTEEAIKEEKISKIKNDLMTVEKLPPCANASYLIEMGYPNYINNQNQNQNQTQTKQTARQQPVVQGNAHVIQQQQQQQVQFLPEPVVQDQALNLENLVNNMSLEVLCSQDEDLDTALHIAISQGNPSLCSAIINRLIKSGRKDALNIKDKLGQTPIYIAVVTNQPNLVYELLKGGADIMIENKDHITPLHYAATKGYAQALRAMGVGLYEGLINNWNINILDHKGMTPLQCAIQAHGRFEGIYDGNQGRYVNKLVDSNDTINNLLLLGSDPAFQDTKSGYNALHYAVQVPPNPRVTINTHVISMILQRCGNAQELLAMKSWAGNTPLHLIAGLDYDEDYIVRVIDLLISFGAEIHVQNLERNNPHDLVDKEKRRKVYSRLQGDHLQGK